MARPVIDAELLGDLSTAGLAWPALRIRSHLSIPCSWHAGGLVAAFQHLFPSTRSVGTQAASAGMAGSLLHWRVRRDQRGRQDRFSVEPFCRRPDVAPFG